MEISNKNKKQDVKDVIKENSITTAIDMASKAGVEVAKSVIPSLLGDIVVDTAASLLPGVSGVYNGVKRARIERNLKLFSEKLSLRIEELQRNFEQLDKEQKEKVDEIFGYITDYVVEEKQQEKIEYMVNGFVKLTEHDQITEDFVLTYYDVLNELRMVDLSTLKLVAQNYFINYQTQQERMTFQDVLDKHGITYEQYQSVRRNLLRKGLFTTKTDENINSDLEEIVDHITGIHDFLSKLIDSKSKRLPKLKKPKLKSKSNIIVSKFGSEFITFFVSKEKDEQKEAEQ